MKLLNMVERIEYIFMIRKIERNVEYLRTLNMLRDIYKWDKMEKILFNKKETALKKYFKYKKKIYKLKGG